MTFKLGTTDVASMYLDTTALSKLYLGSTEIWSAAPPFILSDTWTDADSSAWNAARWPVTNSIVDIQSNEGRLTGGGHPMAVSSVSATNFELLVKGSGSTFSGNIPEINYRLQAISTGTNGYGIQIIGTQVILFLLGGYANIGSISPSGLDVNGSFWFRVRVVGNSHLIRWWPTSGSEPGTWQLSVTDATYASGYFGLACWAGGTTTWDDLQVTALP